MNKTILINLQKEEVLKRTGVVKSEAAVCLLVYLFACSGSLYVTLAVLELAMKTRLALNSETLLTLLGL